MERTRQHSHCGKCSQCIDRRLVAISAGLDDSEDPEIMYNAKMDTPRNDPRDCTMVERYIGTALSIQKMPDEAAFMSEFGEVARALLHVGTDAETALKKIFDLHKRHADQVLKALAMLIERSAARLVDRTIPATSPIGIAAGLAESLGVPLPAPVASDSDKAGQAIELSFHIDHETFTVWNGGLPCELRNTIEFRVISRLAVRIGKPVSIESLLQNAWDGEERSRGTVQKTISNLRRRLREAGIRGIEIDNSIRGHYALKISTNGKR